jgi:putative hydrolase of the HAD superfamily
MTTVCDSGAAAEGKGYCAPVPNIVVFDGDDTLWFVEHLYDDARAGAAEIVAGFGIDPVAWDALERRIDVEHVATMGFQWTRFPTSCARAYLEAALAQGLRPSSAEAAEVWRCAAQVFEREAIPAPGARQVLSELRSSFRLVLLTQGDPWVQKNRIAQSGLEPLFDAVEIVDRKTKGSFLGQLSTFSAPAAGSWSIGNSLPSDINTAMAAGMSAVWVDAHVWDHERREVEPVEGQLLRAKNLEEIPALIAAARCA